MISEYSFAARQYWAINYGQLCLLRSMAKPLPEAGLARRNITEPFPNTLLPHRNVAKSFRNIAAARTSI